MVNICFQCLQDTYYLQKYFSVFQFIHHTKCYLCQLFFHFFNNSVVNCSLNPVLSGFSSNLLQTDLLTSSNKIGTPVIIQAIWILCFSSTQTFVYFYLLLWALKINAQCVRIENQFSFHIITGSLGKKFILFSLSPHIYYRLSEHTFLELEEKKFRN